MCPRVDMWEGGIKIYAAPRERCTVPDCRILDSWCREVMWFIRFVKANMIYSLKLTGLQQPKSATPM